MTREEPPGFPLITSGTESLPPTSPQALGLPGSPLLGPPTGQAQKIRAGFGGSLGFYFSFL